MVKWIGQIEFKWADLTFPIHFLITVGVGGEILHFLSGPAEISFLSTLKNFDTCVTVGSKKQGIQKILLKSMGLKSKVKCTVPF